MGTASCRGSPAPSRRSLDRRKATTDPTGPSSAGTRAPDSTRLLFDSRICSLPSKSQTRQSGGKSLHLDLGALSDYAPVGVQPVECLLVWHDASAIVSSTTGMLLRPFRRRW